MTDDRKRNTGGEVELLPLPKPPYIDEHNLHGGRLAYSIQQIKDYARANVERALAESREQRDHLVAEYERAVGCGPQGYLHAAMHLFNAITNAQVDQNAQAIVTLRAEVATEKGRREHTQQWYAERLAKIEEVAKREGLWPEIAAIIANGSGTRQLPNGSYVYDPPTYAQQLNSAKHKAERAEARAERLAGALREIADVGRDENGDRWFAGEHHATCGALADAALEQEPQE